MFITLKNKLMILSFLGIIIIFAAFSGNVYAEWLSAEPDSWNVPDKWFMNIRSGSAELDTSQSHGGSRSIKLNGTAYAGNYVVIDTPWSSNTSEKQYTFSVYYMASGGYDGIPGITVRFLNEYCAPLADSSGEAIKHIYGQSGDSSWTQITGTLTAPTSTSKFLIYLETEGLNGDVWFDDANVYYNSSPSENLVVNPGFEDIFQQMSDTDFFSKLNLDYAGLEDVKTAVNNNDYELARSEYLNYFRTRTDPLMIGGRNSTRPSPEEDFQTYWADLVVDHCVNYEGGYDKELYIGPDVDWSYLPPNGESQWLGYLNYMQDENGDVGNSHVKLRMSMDGGADTGTSDYSSFFNHGTIQGTNSEWSTSRKGVTTGGALKITSGTSIEVQDSDTLDVTAELSIEGWLRFEGTVSDSYAVHKNNAYYLKAADANGKPSAAVYVDGAWRTVISPEMVSGNKWFHIGVSYSSQSKQLKIYVNGILKATSTLSGLNGYSIGTSDSFLAVGRDSSTPGSYFNGYIDELRISDIARDEFVPSEVPEADTDTIVLFKFDEAAGTSASDSSTNSNTGTVQGSSYEWSTANFNESFKTNGTGYIRVEDDDSFDITDELTVQGWFRFNGNPNDSFVIHKGNAYGLKLADSNGLPSASVYVDGTWRTVSSNETIQSNTWYHLAMTYSVIRKELKLYVNGTLVNSLTLSGLSDYNINTSSSWLDIGRDSQSLGLNFNGFIDDIRISDTCDTSFLTMASPNLIMGILDEAYWYTGNEKYANELIQIMLDWTKDNHYREDEYETETNWSELCTAKPVEHQWATLLMGINLGHADWYLHTVRDSNSLTAERFIAIMKSLYERMADFNERYYRSGNGVPITTNFAYEFAVNFPEFSESGTWRDTFVERLYSTLNTIVHNDGVSDELAPNYHNVTVYYYELPIETAELNNYTFPQDYKSDLEKMYDYIMYSMKPDRTNPQFSDSDKSNIKAYLNQAYNLFGREDMLYVATDGESGIAPDITSYGFPYAGQYFMRSGWDTDANYLGVDMGPLGTAHYHQDKLNFELTAYGKDIIVDPGRYTYTNNDWFDYQRNTISHNTVIVDGNGQLRWLDAANREAEKAVNSEPVMDSEFIASEYFDYAEGLYDDGYYGTELDKSVAHKRKIFFVKPGYWIIRDIADVTSGTHTIDDMFQFAPGCNLNIDSTTKIAVTGYTAEANLMIIPLNPDSLSYSVVSGGEDPIRGWYFEKIGIKNAAPNLRYTKTSVSSSTSFDFVFYPCEAGTDPDVDVQRLEVLQNGTALSTVKANAMKIIVAGNGEKHYIMFSDIGRGKKVFGNSGIDEIGSDAEKTFVVRDSVDNSIKEFTLINGNILIDNGTGRVNIYTDKEDSYFTAVESGTSLEIVTDLNFNDSDAVRIYGNGIISVTVNGVPKTFKTEGDYITIGKAAYLPDTDMKLLMHFDERDGSIATDSSGRSDISVSNGMIWNDGKNGSAAGFDASNYITVSDSDKLDITDDLTLEGWFKWDGTTAPCYMLMKGDAYGLSITAQDLISCMVKVDGGFRTLNSGVEMPVNEWTHVAMTYSSSTSQIKVYVNGILKATNTLSGLSSYQINASTGNFTIGRDASGWGLVYSGGIDEVCISNTVKSSFSQDIPLLCDTNTILLLNFNEGQGNLIADSSGENGALAQGDNQHAGAMFSSAAVFDDSSYVLLGDSDSLDITDKLTIEGWFKWDGTYSPCYMLMKGDAYGLSITAQDIISCMVKVDNGFRTLESGVEMPVNEWTHVAMTYSVYSKKIKIYVNGELKATNTLSGLNSYLINASTSNLTIGRDSCNWGLYFPGRVDEVRVSDTIRYNSMQDVPYTTDKNTALLLHFNDRSGMNATDSSNYGNNGVFQSSANREDGKYRNAVNTNSTMYYTITDKASLDITDELTVEGWFKWDGTYSPCYMLMKGEAYGLSITAQDMISCMVMVDGDFRTLNSGVEMPVNVWIHVAMTYSSSAKQIKIYINGVLEATNTLSGLNSYLINISTSNLNIGRDASGWGLYFPGCIDEVCISSTVRTDFPLIYQENTSIDDFETGTITAWTCDSTGYASISTDTSTAAESSIGGNASISFPQGSDGSVYGWIRKNPTVNIDASAYDGISLWVKGGNTGYKIGLVIRTNYNGQARTFSNYSIDVASSQWQKYRIPWSAFGGLTNYIDDLQSVDFVHFEITKEKSSNPDSGNVHFDQIEFFNGSSVLN